MKIYEITKPPLRTTVLEQEIHMMYETDLPPTSGFFSKLTSSVISTLKIFSYYEALVKPFITYAANMKVVEANLARDGNNPAAIAKFNNSSEMQMGQLIAGLAAGIATKAILGSIGVFGKFVSFIPGIGPIIGKTLELLSVSAQTWVIAELQSEESRRKIAEALTFSVINLGFGTIPLPYEVNLTQQLGVLGNKVHAFFEDLFKRAIGMKKLDDPNTNNQQLDPNATPPEPPLTPEQDKGLVAKLFGTDRPVEKELPVAGEYLGSRMQRNPVTGKIEMKKLQ